MVAIVGRDGKNGGRAPLPSAMLTRMPLVLVPRTLAAQAKDVAWRARKPIRDAVMIYSVRSRQQKARIIREFMRAEGCTTMLMVGAVSDHADERNMGVLERAVAQSAEVMMGINVTDEKGLSYPFTQADARDMPFEDNFVDFALANAIIEHVGDEADQRRFISENTRVARAWAITTPNKWFPIESHTAAMFVHWLPSWRARQPQFTRLLSLREFRTMLPPGTEVTGHWWSPTFTALYSKPQR